MKAFLSHTSSDKDLVGLVQKKLTQANAWYDAVDIENGESIPEKINDGLRNATHYVFALLGHKHIVQKKLALLYFRRVNTHKIRKMTVAVNHNKIVCFVDNAGHKFNLKRQIVVI